MVERWMRRSEEREEKAIQWALEESKQRVKVERGEEAVPVDSRWPPPWGLPSKGTAAEDTQSCTSCKNHTSSENRSMEDTKRRRSNERPGASQRNSRLRSVTVVADSPLRAICGGSRATGMYLCNCVFALSRLMEQSHGPPALKGGRARRGRHWLPAIRLGSARACL